MTHALRTNFTAAEIDTIWDVLCALADDLAERNGYTFKSRTVDLLGEAEDVFKLITGEFLPETSGGEVAS